MAKIIHFWSKFSQNKIGGSDGRVSDVNTDKDYIQAFPENHFVEISQGTQKWIFSTKSQNGVLYNHYTIIYVGE